MVLLAALIVCAMVPPLLASLTSVTENLRPQTASSERPYVILMRHGEAPGRVEPRDFDLNDCSTQRGLSDKGRKEARELGEALRERHIKVSKVVTSRWCRAQETAELMNVGPIETNPAFDNLEFNKHRSGTLIDRERKLIEAWQGPGLLLIVTHSSNIKVLAGLDIEQGTIIVVSPTGEDDTPLHFSKSAIGAL